MLIGFTVSICAILVANHIGFIGEESNILAIIVLGIPVSLIFLYFMVKGTINRVVVSIERSRNNKAIGDLEDL